MMRNCRDGILFRVEGKPSKVLTFPFECAWTIECSSSSRCQQRVKIDTKYLLCRERGKAPARNEEAKRAKEKSKKKS